MTKVIDISTRQEYVIQAKKEGENKTTCPKCSQSRKNRQDRCLQWNEAKGVGHCYHCSADFVKYDPLMRQRPEREYVVPEWRNKTDLSDKAVKWFGGRMISQDTLMKMRIFTDNEYMPQYGKAVEVICFPYFRNGVQVNIKFRGPAKSFKMVSDAELVFYNIDCVKNHREIIIVEGEMDALSFVECGFGNVISVPNGASGKEMSYLDNCIDDLAHIETFYIATDFDEPGINLRNELIRRLGPEKCRIVLYEGCKDINEFLCAGNGPRISEILRKSESPPMKGILNLDSVYDNIRAVWQSGLGAGHPIGIRDIDKLITWRTGQLVVITGIPSHGKSEVLNLLATRFDVAMGWKSIFFSPENMPYDRYLYPKLASMLSGKEFRKGYMDEDMFERVFDHIADNYKFIDAEDDYSVETIIDIAKTAVKRYGVKVLFIDPYNCFEHRKKSNESETEYIGRFLDSLVRFSRKYDVLVVLVAHPRKMDRMKQGASYYERPTLYDINGSANFYNKADIGITIYRRFKNHPDGPGTEFIVSKVKFKEQGEVGIAELQYNIQNGRYSNKLLPEQNIDDIDCSNWIAPVISTQATALNSIPDYDNECPF